MKSIWFWIVALLPIWSQAQTTQPNRIIGVYSQPISSFSTWQQRGVNTLFRWETQGNTITVDAYFAAANTAGLYVIPQDDGSAKAHYGDGNCLGVAVTDESNDNITATQLGTEATTAYSQGAKAFFVNFDGWKMRYQTDTQLQPYVNAVKVAAKGRPTVWMIDYYVINRGEVTGIAAWRTYVLPQIRRLQNWNPNDQVLVFVETSFQKLNMQGWTQNPDSSGTPPGPRMRCPTTGEFGEEEITALKWADGTVYFPDVIGTGWIGFDGTPPDIAFAMPRITGAVRP
jgi:hypothetical protein